MPHDGPIIDAHHHIWLLDRTPWLNGPPVPRIFGDYGKIRRDYPIAEFADDVRPSGVTKSVYIQINVAPGDEVWEAGWAAEQGRAAGLVQAVVGYAALAAPDVGDILDAQLAAAPLRGIRQQFHWHDNPAYRFAASPDALLDPAVGDGLRALAARGLHFELQVFPNQYQHALALVDAHPNLTFVLLHCGMPEAPDEAWAQGISRFAERPNMRVKISGLGTFSHRCDAAIWTAIIHRAIDSFGPERAMFGSNFPIEKLWTDYASIVGAVAEALSTYSPTERRAVWHDTAAQLYNI